MATATGWQSIAGLAPAENSDAAGKFNLSSYSASLSAPSGFRRRDLPEDVRETCPTGCPGQVHTLILHRPDLGLSDETAVVLDVLRAGFLVLSCRRVPLSSQERSGVAYFLYVWRK